MASTLPDTPGRGRSRFSKVLPIAPGAKSPISIKSDFRSSPLPPLPKDARPPTMSIPRRPVGGPKSQNPVDPSTASLSSVYSGSPRHSESSLDSSEISMDSNSVGESESGAVPPIPPKDSQRAKADSISEHSPTHILASPAAGFTSSPPRPEIWKRRSLRSEKDIQIPDLKLQKSNGSTTSPKQNRQEQPAERDLAAIPFNLPRSTGRKPLPEDFTPPQPDSVMGSKLSKLKEKHERKRSNSSSRDGGASFAFASPKNTIHSPTVRLPTPPDQLDGTYMNKEQPSTPQVFSPQTPHTPPEEELPPAVPRKSSSRPSTSSMNGQNSVSTSSTVKPNLLMDAHSRQLSETLTITSEPAHMRSPRPQKSFDKAKILTPQPTPSPGTPSPANATPNKVTPTKIHFPTQPLSPEGTIFQSLPLNILHFECYQDHRFMRSTKNHLYSTACMVCQGQDTEARWRCSWCCLSACKACVQVLASVPDRSLRLCMEKIGKPVEF